VSALRAAPVHQRRWTGADTVQARRSTMLGVQPQGQAEARRPDTIEGFRAIRGLSEATLFHAYRNAVVSGEDLA
jgi:hypothetical protein